MPDRHDLELLIKSHVPVIVVETHEEKRVFDMFTTLSISLKKPLFHWSATEGLSRGEFDDTPQRHLAKPEDMLKHIKANSIAGIYLLPDFHPFLDDPIVVRLIKEIAINHDRTPDTLVFISHELEIPPEIRTFSAKFELSLPNKEAIEKIIREEASTWSKNNLGQTVKTDRSTLDIMVKNLMGLTSADVRRLCRGAIRDDGAITDTDIPKVSEAKYKLLDRGGVLSFEYETSRFSEVGGLDNLKRWLELRKDVFIEQDETLDPPKGILLVGIQGGGKSLAAKAVAGMWQLPLLRLDMGTLYNKYIGETEKNLRDALKTADVMAPCVMWIDEIEKGISGGDGNDNGTSRRVLGTLLTWMAEKNAPVFIVATANDIESLPPELIRKGRLDEIFFVDLPNLHVRKIIFEIHLKKRNLDPATFDLNAFSEKTQGFTGAEIEQAVVSSLYLARAQKTPLNDSHIIEEIERTRPLSVVMSEKIAHLRAWAKDRTVSAN